MSVRSPLSPRPRPPLSRPQDLRWFRSPPHPDRRPSRGGAAFRRWTPHRLLLRAAFAVFAAAARTPTAVLTRRNTGSAYRPNPASRGDRGMSTAEYAVGTVTACAFAAVLFAILTSAEVRDTLTQIVTDALQIDG
ncbi:hypothetical protein GCM10027570_32900 [Streptomonospora sediminis]